MYVQYMAADVRPNVWPMHVENLLLDVEVQKSWKWFNDKSRNFTTRFQNFLEAVFEEKDKTFSSKKLQSQTLSVAET